MYNMNKDITDRAYTDVGSCWMVWNEALSKYSLFLPVTNMPATGSAPDQVEKTVTTDRKKTYVEARQDNPQREFTYYAHRDNFTRLKELGKGQHQFLQINPDFTGWRFTGSISTYQDETSVGNNITGKGVVTVSSSDLEPVLNVFPLIADTVVFDSEIPDVVYLATTLGTSTVSIKTVPSDATVTVVSDTAGVATATYSAGTLTITGVAEGSAIITVTASKSGFGTFKRSILVIVPATA